MRTASPSISFNAPFKMRTLKSREGASFVAPAKSACGPWGAWMRLVSLATSSSRMSMGHLSEYTMSAGLKILLQSRTPGTWWRARKAYGSMYAANPAPIQSRSLTSSRRSSIKSGKVCHRESRSRSLRTSRYSSMLPSLL